MTTLTLIGSVFILVGVGVGIILFAKLFRAIRSKTWPTAEGKLESSDLRTVVYIGASENGGGWDSAKAIVTDFRYTDTVDGKTYTGKRVTFSDFANKTGFSLKKLQETYRGQSNIRVHYNPNDPEQSVLIPGAAIYNFTPLITAFLFIAAGTFMLNYTP